MSDEAAIDRLIENLRLTGAPDPERFREFVAKWVAGSSDLDKRIAVARYDHENGGATIKVDYEWQRVESAWTPWVGMYSPYFGVRTVFDG